MLLPASPTLQIVLSHNKPGKGGHATMFRFQGQVWSKAIQVAQILTLRFFFFHSCQKKNSIFISIHWKSYIVFYLTSFHGAFPAHFLYTLWREWITGSQTLFWPSTRAGLNICAHVEREDLNSKEVAGQTDNVLAGAAEKYCAQTAQLYLRWVCPFPNARKVFKKYK